MPICRAGSKVIYFAHVPKCGGTSVEHYLTQRFGPLGMLDPHFNQRSPAEAWSLTPPQHIPDVLRVALLPNSLFDAIFATVRHPATRLQSVFLFQRDIEGALPAHIGFETWIERIPRLRGTTPDAFSGHLRAMSDLVPQSAEIFRLEIDFDRIIPWLDALTGTSDAPRTLPRRNVRTERAQDAAPPPPISPQALERIARLYAADYTRFDYPIDPAELDRST